jgi:outer membrane lipoprotein LolB
MTLRSPAAAWLLALSMLGITGCASPPRVAAPPDATATSWTGRLALQVENQPSQSFSAGFELKGNAQSGELTLMSPIGGTLAVLSWRPGSATLLSGGKSSEFESVEALVAHATGSPIPVAALFDWLRGVDAPVPGWKADLSQLGQGRILAKRLDPPPIADLRVVFER